MSAQSAAVSIHTPLIEQFMLSACLDYHRSRPNSRFRGVHARFLFPSDAMAFDPRYAECLGYTHLFGDAKHDPRVGRRLEERVREEDPAAMPAVWSSQPQDHSDEWCRSGRWTWLDVGGPAPRRGSVTRTKVQLGTPPTGRPTGSRSDRWIVLIVWSSNLRWG